MSIFRKNMSRLYKQQMFAPTEMNQSEAITKLGKPAWSQDESSAGTRKNTYKNPSMRRPPSQLRQKPTLRQNGLPSMDSIAEWLPKKTDHLEHYVEVRPFARAEGTCKKPDGSSCRIGRKTDDGQYQFNGTDWKSKKNTRTGKNELVKTSSSSSSSKKTSSSSSSSKKTSSSSSGGKKMTWQQFRSANKGNKNVSADWEKYKANFDAKSGSSGGAGSSSGGTASVLGKAAGWAWGSAENKESVKSKFSAMGAASSSFWWCYENPRACAAGVVVGGAVGAFAISTAWAWATAFVATAAWYSAIGLAALVLASGTYLAFRSAMLKTYDDGEEYASLSTSDLEAKIVELKANQCYRIDVRASCYTAVEHLKAAEDALSFQNKICDGSDCDDVRALFKDIQDEDLSEEDQDELIQKRKDLFFGHIWSAHESADDEKIKELEAKNQKELKKLCEDFTTQNRRIFQYKENNKLVKASLTPRHRGILTDEYETKDILKVLADKQKEIIGLHATAVDEWVELYKAFEGHMNMIHRLDLFRSLEDTFVTKLENAGEFKPPPILLSDGDKDKQMRTKLKLERKVINKNVKKMQELVNAIDASEEGSVVARIQEERKTKECFVNSVGDIRDIFREHQKKLQKKGALNADIAKAEIAIEKPTKELMKRICDGDYPEDADALKLAKWVLGNIQKNDSDKESDSDDAEDDEILNSDSDDAEDDEILNSDTDDDDDGAADGVEERKAQKKRKAQLITAKFWANKEKNRRNLLLMAADDCSSEVKARLTAENIRLKIKRGKLRTKLKEINRT